MDEAEAFLHPSLALTLGKEICRILSTSNRQLFVATHSPDFVMGCINSGVSVSIIRLTHSKQASTARLLPHDELKTLMRKPMLRSTGALRGLFYQSVVATEADADRAFYNEINERLLATKPEWGATNSLFLNANGKDTISDIVTPLRALGIPTAAIVDLDVVEQGGANWTKFMDACHVPTLERPALELSRSNIHKALVSADKDYKRKGGIGVLGTADREAATNFLARLAQYGLFVVARGEVEHWLSNIALNRSKGTWLREVFEKLGDQPDQPAYVKPAEDDVWKFMFDVKRWLVDSKRSGIPT